MDGQWLIEIEDAANKALNVLIPLALTLLTTYASYLAHKASKWIEAKKDGEVKVVAMQAVGELNKMVQASVSAFEQSIRPTINQGGKLSDLQAGTIRNKVAGAVLGQVSDSTKTMIELVVNDIEKHVGTQIDKAVFEMNREREACAPPIPGQLLVSEGFVNDKSGNTGG